MSDKPTPPPPAYFLSLSLENVRSFGTKQTISFARPDGRPAQWTIILGDNGVGKTTVLKALAGLMPSKSPTQDEDAILISLPHIGMNWSPIRHDGQKEAIVASKLEVGLNLTDSIFQSHKASVFNYGFRLYRAVQWSNNLIYDASVVDKHPSDAALNKAGRKNLVCYGYGAGRTVGNSTLSETPETINTCARA
jgi:energy-coupling factor transporter ATP-binding protein EcfA2